MHGVRLQTAPHKTEILLVSNCKAVPLAEISVGEHTIAPTRVLKYLSVMIDDRLNFNSRVDYSCERVAKATNVVARIMPNSYGPICGRRHLLAVSLSVLRYGAPAWVSALKTKRIRRN